MNRGGEHHREHQLEGEARLARELAPIEPAMPGVHDYIDYLEDHLGEPLSRRLHEGFRWLLEDALGVETEALSEDERRALQWLAGWDHWTVENVGKLFNRARAQAHAEGRAAMEDAR